MMDHQQARDQFSSYYEKELGQREKEDIEAHLASCSACSGEYGIFRQTVEAVRGMPLLDVPPSLYHSLRKRADRRRKNVKAVFSFFLLGRVPHEVFSLLLLCALFAIAYVVYTPEAEKVSAIGTPASFPRADLKLSTRSPSTLAAKLSAAAAALPGAAVEEMSAARIAIAVPSAGFKDFIIRLYKIKEDLDAGAPEIDAERTVAVEIRSK